MSLAALAIGKPREPSIMEPSIAVWQSQRKLVRPTTTDALLMSMYSNTRGSRRLLLLASFEDFLLNHSRILDLDAHIFCGIVRRW